MNIRIPAHRADGELTQLLSSAVARLANDRLLSEAASHQPDPDQHNPSNLNQPDLDPPNPDQTDLDPLNPDRHNQHNPDPHNLDQPHLDTDSDTKVHLWIEEVSEGDDEVARQHGFKPYRDLWQLRCGLPQSEKSNLPTKAFTSADMDEYVAVNNRAFHWHPEQGGMTTEAVSAVMTESWFDANGFRLHRRNGRLAGFCWTKIHSETTPQLGEIYVIAVDPDFTGQGLGRRMTLAGLEWLANRGLRTGMLYVESDNHPANAVYRRIGFTHHHTDRAYWYVPS